MSISTLGRAQKTASRFFKSTNGRSKTKSRSNNSRSPNRKSSYSTIEKEERRLSKFSPPTITPLMGKPLIEPDLHTSKAFLKKEQIPLPVSSASNFNISVHSSNTSVPKGDKKDLPFIKIKPIKGPRDVLHTSVFRASSTEQGKEAPPPSDAEKLVRDPSLLANASFPSIDTGLFNDLKGTENEENDPIGIHIGDVVEPQHGVPPSMIQTIISHDQQGSMPRAASDVPRALPDEAMLTGAPSRSGTGSKKLEMWLHEVNRSIAAANIPAFDHAAFDRYHDETLHGDKPFVCNTPDHVEEEQAKIPSYASGMKFNTQKEADQDLLMENQRKIDQSLRETIQKSMARRSASPRGILKVKTVENGTIRDDTTESESTSDEGNTSDPVLLDDSRVQRTMPEARPIKVFSKSRRQRLRDNSFSTECTEDEATTSIASQSTSGSEEDGHGSLRHLSRAASRDTLGSTRTQESSPGLFKAICDFSDIIEDYDKELCHGGEDMEDMDRMMNDDNSVDSRSAYSKDSYAPQRGGWLCFGM